MTQLLAHLVGDYILQSSWMAMNKSKRSWICALHCFLYTLPFLILTRSPLALAGICASHFLIDRFGLTRYLIWFKNWFQPGGYYPWSWCSFTGYFDEELIEKNIKLLDLPGFMMAFRRQDINRPIWIRVWLLIITDNTLHLICNALAIAWLPALER